MKRLRAGFYPTTMKNSAFSYQGFVLYLSQALCLALSISGCANNDMSDLQAKVDDVKAQKVVDTTPLQNFPREEIYLYPHTQTTRSPFARFDEKPTETTTVISPKDDPRCRPPDIHRNRETLESYPLDALKMVGTLNVENMIWGLLQDPNGLIHQIQVNNYVGQNNGKVTYIGEDVIELREIADDGTGCFMERDANLKISGNDEKS